MTDQRPTVTRRDALRWLGATALASGAAALAACTSERLTHTPAGSHGGRVLDVTRFGAVGDGRTDDTEALSRALLSLRTGDVLVFPGGRVFTHDAVLVVATHGVELRGPGTLEATNEAVSSLQIAADDVTVDGLQLAMRSTTQRWAAPAQHKLYVGTSSGAVIRRVHISGSAAAGLFCDGASDFHLDRVRVSDTRADGIHMTNGCRAGVVSEPLVERSGDDAVAVVSYAADSGPCHDIVVTSPTVHGTTGGRGLSVVGGHDVHYRDVDVNRSAAAGVYLACEGGDFVTAPTRAASVRGGRITGANTDSAIDHGAVLVYSGRTGGTVSHIVVADLAVSGTRATASRQIGVVADSVEDGVSDVVFDDIRLAATPTPYQGDAPLSGVTLHAVTAAGTRVVAA